MSSNKHQLFKLKEKPIEESPEESRTREIVNVFSLLQLTMSALISSLSFVGLLIRIEGKKKKIAIPDNDILEYHAIRCFFTFILGWVNQFAASRELIKILIVCLVLNFYLIIHSIGELLFKIQTVRAGKSSLQLKMFDSVIFSYNQIHENRNPKENKSRHRWWCSANRH